MKRLLIAILLACITAGVAYALFLRTCPETRRFDCEIKWLSYKLALSPEQTERIRAIHLKHCPSMNGLGTQVKTCGDPALKDKLVQACGQSTDRLIQEVQAELTAEQRVAYAALLEARGQQKQSVPVSGQSR